MNLYFFNFWDIHKYINIYEQTAIYISGRSCVRSVLCVCIIPLIQLKQTYRTNARKPYILIYVRSFRSIVRSFALNIIPLKEKEQCLSQNQT
jgi:hypothetical protein